MRFLWALLALACLPAVSGAETLRVGAAVSLKEVLGALTKAHEAETGNSAQYVFASSGQLAAQIKAGAPMDVFISAANAQADELATSGLVVASSRKEIARNRIVLITPRAPREKITSFDDLRAMTGKLAVGEPRVVPAGAYAMQVLRSLGLEAAVQPRLLFGANVRQVLSYVERGEVPAGIVYATDARESGGKVTVVAVAPESSHAPVVYPAVIVTASKKAPAAGKFIAFLSSDKVRAVFTERGFTLP